MDFIRNWQPDLLITLLLIIGDIAQFSIALIIAIKVLAKRWLVGGIFATLFGLILLDIRFI